ncbi:hypothetical protein JX265_012858 [Neoarthrinium moseri]|uniref:Uncharacterized protein n=1 Tax=Neoarthrinium moseri TaxID=1658444 RepID=A0A9Q0AI92_9PEZI|nr:hypothetical protein JX265_012858 [Neoarthrinium moseri]
MADEPPGLTEIQGVPPEQGMYGIADRAAWELVCSSEQMYRPPRKHPTNSLKFEKTKYKAMESKSFFNLPQAASFNGNEETAFFGAPRKYTRETNWKTFKEQSMSKQSLLDVFAGTIPVLRQKEFLSRQECARMVDVLESHKIASTTLSTYGLEWDVSEAYSLQDRWKNELGIDIVHRIIQSLQRATGMAVRRAREADQDYFAGVIRAIDSGIQIHTDYAPFEGKGWEIGRIVAQMSWNILLNPVPGGDTFVFDRQWQAPQDDLSWRKDFPKYAYDPRMVEGCVFKVVKPTPGDLYWFNPRWAQSYCHNAQPRY